MEWFSHNWRDIHKYYKDTYIKLYEHSGEKLWHVTSVNEDRVMLINPEDGEDVVEIKLWEDKPFNVEMILPQKATFQMGKVALCLSRVPAQMFKRGISSENCIINTLMPGGWQPSTLSFSRLTAYVQKQEYFSPTELLRGDGKISVAFGRRWSCTCDGNIFVDTKHCGTILFNQKTYDINLVVKAEFIRAIAQYPDMKEYTSN
jgi:hypothetical protein